MDAATFGMMFVFWIAATAILVPFVAHEKGRSAIGWAFFSLFFSPLLTLLALAAVPSVEHKPEEKPSWMSAATSAPTGLQ